MMARGPVDRLYEELAAALRILRDANEPSLQSVIQDQARKAMLLAAASYFEHRITTLLEEMASSAANPHLREFVRNKAISRQYHTLFDWSAKNANSFFGLFGADFKMRMKEMVSREEELGQAIRAFLELGEERNRLVHQDYVSFSLEKTTDEIFTLYQAALRFVDELPGLLNDF